jgi:hypothetical protein
MELNIFRHLGLNENQHSKMLTKFLYPYSNINQAIDNHTLFIDKFLELLGIKNMNTSKFKKGKMTEKRAGKKGRIDIYFEIENHKFIIENKLKGAKNQQNQLYRYWYNAIFYKDKKNKKDFETFCDERNIADKCSQETHNLFFAEKQSQNCTVIYIARKDKMKNLEANDTFKKPKSYNKQPTKRNKPYAPEEIPAKLKENIVKLTEDDLINWLSECVEELNNANTNIVLISIIKQYIEGLKTDFK